MTDLSMTEKAREEFLIAGRVLRLATVNKDGTPHIAPIWYLYENGKIYVRTSASSVKARNIRRSNKVAACVDVGEFYYDLKNVVMKGTARILGDEDLAQRVAEKIMVKYLGSTSHPQARKYLSSGRKSVVIEIEPARRMHSEDYSLLK